MRITTDCACDLLDGLEQREATRMASGGCATVRRLAREKPSGRSVSDGGKGLIKKAVDLGSIRFSTLEKFVPDVLSCIERDHI